MLQKYNAKLTGVCPSQVYFEVNDNDEISSIEFDGGCNGNLKTVAKLLDGKQLRFAYDQLTGIMCGKKNTSCSDQFAQVILKAINQRAEQSRQAELNFQG
jgi:uncharacterized protein (TIGR03905 family)